MAIAEKLKIYLTDKNASYELVAHPRTGSSMETAEAAHVPGDQLAKAVIVKDKEHFAVVVLPSDHHLDLDNVGKQLDSTIAMATEEELASLFPDCTIGAIPPLGDAYGIKTLLDTSLEEQAVIYFEAGDHEQLVQTSGEQFTSLMANAVTGRFSHHI
jgi:Ala-tRNA(Pro) deacylase